MSPLRGRGSGTYQVAGSSGAKPMDFWKARQAVWKSSSFNLSFEKCSGQLG
jgi:hypothetical protein